MTSGKSTPASADLLKQLESEDSVSVLKALVKLEKVANINDLPAIVRVMAGVTDQKLLREFTFFLSKVKSSKAPAMMAQFITDPAYVNIRVELVRACWESYLDYTPHLLMFARIFIASDYLLALEAFTVIENACQDFPASRKLLEEISILIKNSFPDQPEAKQRLTRELILVLEPFVTEG